MKIALDASFLGATGGIGTYTFELVRSFAQLYNDQEFLLISNKLPESIPQYARQQETYQSRMPELPPKWKQIQTYKRFRQQWWLLTLPKILREHNPAIFHAIDGVSIPSFKKTQPLIVTIHDIIPITNPEFCRYRDVIAAQLLMRHAINKADMIIAVSQYSAGQILAKFPHVQSRLTTIYEGIDHNRFTPAPNRQELAQTLSNRYALFSPHFLLCVATLNPRRNLVRLIRSFSEYIHSVNDSDACLVIAGCRGWKDNEVFQTINQMNLETRVHFLQDVSDNDIVQLNQSALAAINVSLLEGFGFPVLEAMACGTPVICSSTTSLGEIAGDAALCIDPTNQASIVEAMYKIIQDQGIRENLSKQGLERSKDFTWENAAKATFEVYEQFI